jgi:hypothetical protein
LGETWEQKYPSKDETKEKITKILKKIQEMDLSDGEWNEKSVLTVPH